MKRSILVLFCFVFLFGCVGSKPLSPEQNQAILSAVDMAGSTAFLLVLNNNKAYIPATVMALELIRKEVSTNEELTYDDLMKLIPEKLKAENPILGILLVDFIAQEKPYFETYLSLFDGYRETIVQKLDRLILLANGLK